MTSDRPFEIGLFTFGEITADPATGRPLDPATRLREFIDLAVLADQAWPRRYPVGTEMYPPDGPGQAAFRHEPAASGATATHATVSLDRSEAEILAVAERESWRAVRLPRGPFDVIELWIENTVMLELMTPDMAAAYLASTPRTASRSG